MHSTTRSNPSEEVVIQPSTGWVNLGLADLWAYRELAYFLTWRDVKVRYKQTVLGASWAVIQPVLTMLVFTIFFGRLGGMEAQTTGCLSDFVYARCCRGTSFLRL